MAVIQPFDFAFQNVTALICPSCWRRCELDSRLLLMENLHQIRSALRQKGIAKLEGLVAPEQAQIAHSMVLELAEEHSLYSAEGWVKAPGKFGVPKTFRKALNKLNRSNEFPELVGDRLTSIIEELIGARVTPLPPGQQLLFSLPSHEGWSIPSDVWHTDLPKFAERTTPGLQAFTFLDDVEPQGGATLVVEGSHRLLSEHSVLSSKQVKDHLRQEGFFARLFHSETPAMTDLAETAGRVGEVELKVIELTGCVGDVYLMDLRLLHTPAPNSSNKARMMPTCRFPRAEVAERIDG
ncbi:phytanoyl-CoA dioxygenase family protein [Altererythrobacter lutimaris]|uniref:Phytanoyl-CoA dioxygenase family protein n=1 Tax=Altererythrobacter lutimaris TaxID=2743979 RepID=A0A850HDV9_9SPHN|nr:phytanoyl-CoA dioxygenase family protein [Altererythrobacter lutimaris]NVE95226.1 phytanoyl-CoA dioxygenase family protein [Altererythrobacter lutimaris]